MYYTEAGITLLFIYTNMFCFLKIALKALKTLLLWGFNGASDSVQDPPSPHTHTPPSKLA